MITGGVVSAGVEEAVEPVVVPVSPIGGVEVLVIGGVVVPVLPPEEVVVEVEPAPPEPEVGAVEVAVLEASVPRMK